MIIRAGDRLSQYKCNSFKVRFISTEAITILMRTVIELCRLWNQWH